MKLNNKEYKIKVSLRAMMIYEQITGKPFCITNMMEQYVYFYAMLLASNDNVNMSYGEFLDQLDEEPNAILDFKQAMEDYGKRMSAFKGDDGTDKKKACQ